MAKQVPASVPITISGVLADKYGRTLKAVTLFGEATIGAPDGQPPSGGGDGDHIWGGGNVPMPSPPIANVPGAPGYQPPGSGGEQPPDGGNGGNGGAGGTPIPPEEMPPPAPPPDQYAQQMVVQVWHPDSQSWTAKAYDEYPAPHQGQRHR